MQLVPSYESHRVPYEGSSHNVLLFATSRRSACTAGCCTAALRGHGGFGQGRRRLQEALGDCKGATGFFGTQGTSIARLRGGVLCAAEPCCERSLPRDCRVRFVRFHGAATGGVLRRRRKTRRPRCLVQSRIVRGGRPSSSTAAVWSRPSGTPPTRTFSARRARTQRFGFGTSVVRLPLQFALAVAIRCWHCAMGLDGRLVMHCGLWALGMCAAFSALTRRMAQARRKRRQRSLWGAT